MKTRAADHSFIEYLMGKFLKPDKIGKENYGAAIQLIQKYPYYEFWDKYELGFKLNSLYYFSGAGKAKLEIAYNHFVGTKSQEISLVDKKFGEDIVIKKKKTLQDII